MRSPSPKSGDKRSAAPKDRKQISLMHVFRAANARGDAKEGRATYTDGARELTERSKERREGTDEETLRKHLTYDLASLMNTISLEAVVDLDEHPYVKSSIVNHGFGDMSDMSESDFAAKRIADLIRETLAIHEPRLIPESVDIQVNREIQSTTQRLTFDIYAEMVATPVDVPLDFVAEVDMGAGKIQMTQLRVKT
jgi:type VI secretion system protein ImpF